MAGLNTFGYVEANPLSYVDPLGLMGFGGGPRNKPGYSRFRPTPGSPFPGYNYCGPGDRGGPPVSCVDAACKKHDECYAACGLRAGTRWVPHFFSGCAAKCDVELSRGHKGCSDAEFCTRTLPPLPPLPLGA